MTKKHHLIVNYLIENQGPAYYIEIRDAIAMNYNSEGDFDKHLYELEKDKIIDIDLDTVVHFLNNKGV